MSNFEVDSGDAVDPEAKLARQREFLDKFLSSSILAFVSHLQDSLELLLASWNSDQYLECLAQSDIAPNIPWGVETRHRPDVGPAKVGQPL